MFMRVRASVVSAVMCVRVCVRACVSYLCEMMQPIQLAALMLLNVVILKFSHAHFQLTRQCEAAGLVMQRPRARR